MNAAPKRKIGRLPKAMQEQVNHRLEHGERARTLVAWLNAVPEVQVVLAAEFAVKPIREQQSASMGFFIPHQPPAGGPGFTPRMLAVPAVFWHRPGTGNPVQSTGV